MRAYLVRIPHRKGHSIQSIVLLASTIAGPGRHIQVTSRVGPNGRDLKLPRGNSDRTTGPPLGLFNLLSVLSDPPAPAGEYNTFVLGSNLSAVPGAKTEWGGTMPPSAIRDWHQCAKS